MAETIKKPRIKPSGVRKKPPANAVKTLKELGARGVNKKSVALALGCSYELLRVWMDQYPELQRAWDEGRESEHDALRNALYDAAMAGNVTAAIFLLKCRHNYQDNGQSDNTNRVSINFQLPGAMPLDQFRQMVDITPQPKRLTDDD